MKKYRVTVIERGTLNKLVLTVSAFNQEGAYKQANLRVNIKKLISIEEIM